MLHHGAAKEAADGEGPLRKWLRAQILYVIPLAIIAIHTERPSTIHDVFFV